MALPLFMDGFDYYTIQTAGLVGPQGAGWDSGSAATNAVAGVYAYGAQISMGNNNMTKTFGSNLSTVYGAFHLSSESSLGNWGAQPFMNLRDGATSQASLRFTPSGGLALYRGTNTALLGSTVPLFSPSVPLWVAFKIVFSATVGTFELWVQGVQVLSLTGLNNIATANAYATNVLFQSGTAGTFRFDNFHLYDGTGAAPFNAILAESRIYFLPPTGAGTASQFTATGAATFWQCVDDVPSNGDTDYGASTVPTNRSDTTRAALTGPTVINAVKYNLTMRKDDAGVRTLSPTVRQGGTYYDAAAISLASVYTIYPTYYPAQADGSGAWNLTALNAAEFGVLDVA